MSKTLRVALLQETNRGGRDTFRISASTKARRNSIAPNPFPVRRRSASASSPKN
jgi:hypothetical protein